jgi:hypothetical protein
MPNRKAALDLDLVVVNLAADLGLDDETTQYVLMRLSNEGFSFLSRTLPQLSKAVLNGLELGRVILPTSFANSHGCFSRYFRVWLLKIFDKHGVVLAQPCAESIKRLRQFCDYFYKLSVSYNKEQLENARVSFKNIEAEVSAYKGSQDWIEKLRSSFHHLYPELMRYKLSDVLNEHKPRTTSGSFYGSENNPEPFYIYKDMSASVVGTTYKAFKAISGYFRKVKTNFDRVSLVEDQYQSKVLFVPKDSRGPRIISKEPLHLVRLQMSYFDFMVKYLENKSFNRINFLDQGINQELARESSVSLKNATLDLKEASDRVSFSLVRQVFRDSSVMAWFFDHARSTHCVLDNKFGSQNLIPLSKLAGMGSGLTFPTMSLLLHLSIATSVVDSFKSISLKEAASKIYVYGDDIIIPSEWYTAAIKGITLSGLRCNREKSFRDSSFRESCGADYFDGVNVVPVRCKLSNAGLTDKSFRRGYVYTRNAFTGKAYRYPTLYLDIVGDMAIYELDRHCRELVKSGLINLANYYYNKLERALGRSYGYVSGDSPYLGRYSAEPIYINDDFIISRFMAVAITDESTLGCPYKFLARSLERAGKEDSMGLPYGVYARPRKIKLIKRKTTAYLLR